MRLLIVIATVLIATPPAFASADVSEARLGAPARAPFWSLDLPNPALPAPLSGSLFMHLTIIDEGGMGIPDPIAIDDYATVEVRDPVGDLVTGTLAWDQGAELLSWQAAGYLTPDTEYAVHIVITELRPDVGFEGDLTRSFTWATHSGSYPDVAFPGAPSSVSLVADCSSLCCEPRMLYFDRQRALNDAAAMLSLRFVDADGALTEAIDYHPFTTTNAAYTWPARQPRYCYQLTAESLINDSASRVEHCFPHAADVDLDGGFWCTAPDAGDASDGAAAGCAATRGEGNRWFVLGVFLVAVIRARSQAWSRDGI